MPATLPLRESPPLLLLLVRMLCSVQPTRWMEPTGTMPQSDVFAAVSTPFDHDLTLYRY